jgi:predicted nucleotidyltransferase
MIREKRQQTLAKIASTIQSNFGPEYRIEVFGSTQYGVDGQTSDLDLIVIVSFLLSCRFISRVKMCQDPDRMTGFAPEVDLSLLPRKFITFVVRNTF